MSLENYIEETSEPLKTLCFRFMDEFKRGCKGGHPKKQKEPNGLRLHTVQVIEKALELNQIFDRVKIIETCLIHDLGQWVIFPLDECQRLAIKATKGLPFSKWRKTPCYKFVVLILIADMWSAFINEKNL